MAYSFDDGGAEERHTTQYFEMFCNRGIYHKGWTAVTRHVDPVAAGRGAAARRRRLGALRTATTGRRRTTSPRSSPRSWRISNVCSCSRLAKYNVFPLDDRRVERFNAELAGQADSWSGNRQILFGGMRRLTENSVVGHKNKSPRRSRPRSWFRMEGAKA